MNIGPKLLRRLASAPAGRDRRVRRDGSQARICGHRYQVEPMPAAASDVCCRWPPLETEAAAVRGIVAGGAAPFLTLSPAQMLVVLVKQLF